MKNMSQGKKKSLKISWYLKGIFDNSINNETGSCPDMLKIHQIRK